MPITMRKWPEMRIFQAKKFVILAWSRCRQQVPYCTLSVDGKVFGDLAVQVNDMQNQFAVFFIQYVDQFYEVIFDGLLFSPRVVVCSSCPIAISVVRSWQFPPLRQEQYHAGGTDFCVIIVFYSLIPVCRIASDRMTNQAVSASSLSAILCLATCQIQYRRCSHMRERTNLTPEQAKRQARQKPTMRLTRKR